MEEENIQIQQPDDVVVCPVPVASPELVARWLRKVRIGVLCGLAVIASHVVYMVFGLVGIVPGPRLAMTISCAAVLAGGVGIWLLVSSEPQNRKWLWWCRWLLRLAAGAVVLLCGTDIVIYGFLLSPLPEKAAQTAHDNMWRVMGIVVCGTWVLLYWYLKALAQRLADKTLRNNFGCLFWIARALFILFLLVVTYEVWIHRGGGAVLPATAPAKAQVDKPNAFVGFAIWMAYYVWMGWLMWRLSRRLNQFAAYYQKPYGQVAPADGRPRQ